MVLTSPILDAHKAIAVITKQTMIDIARNHPLSRYSASICPRNNELKIIAKSSMRLAFVLAFGLARIRSTKQVVIIIAAVINTPSSA